MMAFTNQASADRPGRVPLTIRLRGRAGNPTAVGARVEVQFSDGTRHTSEVHAGDGYLSQSSAIQFIPHASDRVPRWLTVRWPNGAVTSTEKLIGHEIEVGEPAP